MTIDVQQIIFENVIQPALLALDMGRYIEDGYRATIWLMWGCIELVLIACILVPLQRWRPVEAVTDPATIRVDMLYTFIHRLGLFRLFMFLSLEPLLDEAFGMLRSGSFGIISLGTFQLDQLWPSVTDNAVVSLLLYLVVFDFLDYWIHRAQHGFPAWWALHSLHHAQRQMTCWSDNRNHLLDDLIRDLLLVCIAFLIGVSPSQFILIVVLTQLSESLQHANLRLSFGRVGERLWVSPRFHRLHHSIEYGFGHNFGVLLPVWDVLFGTANFDDRYEPTGIDALGVDSTDYGRGFWAQQWLGFKRLVRT
ncbi:MAG: sterol desaturase family protein [Cytophagales bacterium]|nr:sterol desaturase family protein [Cytophagales bacterium]